jgi:hypothetical protein
MKKLDDRLPISELVKTVAAFDPMVRDVVLTKNEATIAINEVYKKFQAFRYATIVSYFSPVQRRKNSFLDQHQLKRKMLMFKAWMSLSLMMT